MRRTLRLAFSLLSTALSYSALADTLPPANKATPKVGDVIEYNPGFATVVCRRWQVKSTDKDGSTVLQCDDKLAYISADGNLKKIVTKAGNALAEFTPHSFGLSFPLAVGKKWAGNYTGYTAYNGSTWGDDESCEVKSVEPVQVPAGQFEAYRIDCVDSWKSGPYSGQSHTSAWYAPKVGITVKFVHAESPEWSYQVTNMTEK